MNLSDDLRWSTSIKKSVVTILNGCHLVQFGIIIFELLQQHFLSIKMYTKILDLPTDCFVEISPHSTGHILHGYSFLFAALYTFYVNLGGFYEWAVLISPAPIFSLDFLILGKSVHPDSKLG